MRGLITDRTQENVLRLKELASKGWAGMTSSEQEEWLGSPLTKSGVNLLPYGPYSSYSVELNATNDSLNVTAIAGGTYQYAVVIVGKASDFVNKTMTLSADYIGTVGGGNPRLSMFWHDDNGYTSIGAVLSNAGSITFNTGSNPNGRAYLAVYVYVSATQTVQAGASARFRGAMLEIGSKRSKFIPYTAIMPTDTTKGAYNYSDMNRVERAAAELSDLYGLCLDTKTDWDIWSVPQASDMVRYITNIKKIRSATLQPNNNVPVPETMDGLSYSDANNIEKILLAAHENTDAICRVGELFSGEV